MRQSGIAAGFDLPTLRKGIEAEALDILLVADPGLHSNMYTLLFSRMAPIQIVLWGGESASALTLGLPNTVDYFISGDHSSPPKLQNELVEQNVRLGGLGYFFPKLRTLTPKEISDAVSRHGVLSQSNLYLVPADLNSLHPAFDDVILGVLRADPSATIMLLCETGQDLWVSKFQRRLRAHKSAADDVEADTASHEGSPGGGERGTPTFLAVKSHRYISRLTFHEESGLVIGAPSTASLRSLMASADVVLDTFPVGLGIHALEALGVGTPVVTAPALQPQRTVAEGALKELGGGLCELLCVSSVESMVKRAVSLASNKTLRAEVHTTISSRFPFLVWKDKWVETASSSKGVKSGEGGGGSFAPNNSDPDATDVWKRARTALGHGDVGLGVLNDWLTFFSRVARPWALDRESSERDAAAKIGAVTGADGAPRGSLKAARARKRKQQQALKNVN